MRSVFRLSTGVRLMVGMSLLLAAQFVRADDFETGKVKFWITKANVRVYNVAPVAGGTARCTGGYIGGMELNITTDYGKAMYSKLLAAEAAGQNVVFAYLYTASNAMCELTSVQSAP